MPECLKDHECSLPKEDGLLTDQQDADDTGWVAVMQNTE